MKSGYVYLLSGMALLWVCTSCMEQGSVLKNVQTVEDAQTTLSNEVDQVLASTSLSTEEKADKITKIGQDAIESPKGFSMAKAVFDEALKVDANNERAQFYSTVLDVPMAFEGVLGDAKNALTEDVNKEISDSLNESGQPEVSDFFLKEDAPKSLNLKHKSDDLRALNMDDEFGIAKPGRIQDILETKILPILKLTSDRLDVFFLTHADFRERIDLSLFVKVEERPLVIVFDKASYLALRVALHAAMAAIKIAVSYDLDDIKALEAHIKSLGEDPGPMEIVHAIQDHPSFLKMKRSYLSSENPNRVLLDLEEVFKSAHGLWDYLTELDSNGDHVRKIQCEDKEKCFPNLDPNNEKVIKIHEYIDLFHDLIDDSKNADGTFVKQPVLLENLGKNEDQSIRVDFTAFLTNREEKFNDLKAFLPTFPAVEGEAPTILFPDLTFGGLFPDQSLFCFLKSQAEEGEEHPMPEYLCPGMPPSGIDSWQHLPEYQPE